MRISTGIDGLDRILHGGLIPSRVYLVHGTPGTGKTTLGLHFLAAGARGLLITFDQTGDRLRAAAQALGLDMASVSVLDLTPDPEAFPEMQTYDIFSPSEIEREPIMHEISAALQEPNIERVFVDGFDQFRDLAIDEFHHRRLVQSFFRFATQRGATVLAASGESGSAGIADGIIQLAADHVDRSIRVMKFRGSDFHAGSHSMRLTAQGAQVLPNAA